MKKNLNINLLLLFISLSLTLASQKYALEIGYSNPTRYGVNASPTNFYGGHLGGTASFELRKNVSLLTGALYSFVYSDKYQGYVYPEGVSYKTQGHFLDIPLQISYSLPLNKNLKFIGFAGPKINIGLYQRQETISTLSYPINDPLYIGSSMNDLYKESLLNRLNLQIGLGGGIQWKNYQLKSGYDWGITNLNKVNTGNLYQKGWYVTFSYEF